MVNIICIIIGCILGCCGVYLYLKPKLENVVKINTEQIAHNQAINEKNNELTRLNDDLSHENNDLLKQQAKATAELNSLNDSIKTATAQFQDISASLQKSANSMYEQSKQIAESKMKATQLLLQKQFDEQKQQLEADYELKKNETAEKKTALQQDIETTEARLAELTAKVQGAIEAARRQEELESNLDFYRLQLSNVDIEEIKKIRSIIPYLRNAEPVNKVIWKVYYERAYTDLIGRVIGTGTHSGIYKITNIQNQKCYVGQSVNLSERWKQHIKRGIGAETPTRNKLYSVMAANGPENFTFEILEECSKEQLNEREKFWGNYFQATSFGYSEKLG